MAGAFAGGVDRHEIECAVYDTVRVRHVSSPEGTS